MPTTPAEIEENIREASRVIHYDGKINSRAISEYSFIPIILGIGDVSKFSFFKSKEFYNSM